MVLFRRLLLGRVREVRLKDTYCTRARRKIDTFANTAGMQAAQFHRLLRGRVREVRVSGMSRRFSDKMVALGG